VRDETTLACTTSPELSGTSRRSGSSMSLTKRPLSEPRSSIVQPPLPPPPLLPSPSLPRPLSVIRAWRRDTRFASAGGGRSITLDADLRERPMTALAPRASRTRSGTVGRRSGSIGLSSSKAAMPRLDYRDPI